MAKSKVQQDDGVQTTSLEQLIAVCLMTPRHEPTDPTCIWGLPLNIVGLSGGGKSERVAAACRAIGLPLQTVFPASKQPEDFGGAPFATPDGIVIECILPQAEAEAPYYQRTRWLRW